MAYYTPFYHPYNYTQSGFQNGFSGQNFQSQGYQQAIPQFPSAQAQQADNTMLGVLNKNEADGYPVAPNCSVVLWDKNSPTIYVKSVSANGVPSMRTLDFVERTEKQNQGNNYNSEKETQYVTKEEFIIIDGKIKELTARCESLEQFQFDKADIKLVKKSKGSEE